MEIKWTSKTMWTSIVTLLLSFSPYLDGLISTNPSLTLKIFAAILAVLRMLTSTPLVTKNKGE
jgi:hypothetical protein